MAYDDNRLFGYANALQNDALYHNLHLFISLRPRMELLVFEWMHSENGKTARVDNGLHNSASGMDSEGVSIKVARDERLEQAD